MKNLNYLMDGSYSVSDIQDYFERILKKHASLSGRMTTLYNRKNNSDVNLHHWMLDIVPSCNLVRYKRKLVMQPWENDKSPNFGPNLGSSNFLPWVLPLIVVRKCFKLSSYATSSKINDANLKKWQKTTFSWFYLYFQLDIVPSYHPMQKEN